MSEKWIKARLGDIVKVNPQADQLPDQFVYVDLESVKCGRLLRENLISKKEAPSRAQRTVKDKDVLFQLVRPYQQNNLYFEKHGSYDYVASTGYAVIRTELESKYYYYYLHRWDVLNRVNAVSTGTGYPAITPCELSKIVVCSPSNVAAQRHIAEVLSTCDEVIEQSERAAEKYRQIKAGMLKDLLTRGLDDCGRLRPPPFASPELYKDSELGPIPREWEVKRLGDVCSVQLGKMLDAAKNVGIEKPYIGNRSVQWGYFELADIETVRLTEQDLGRFRLQKGDLIVCEGGEVGRCAIWNDELSECYYQKALHRVRLLAGVEYSIPFLANCFQYFASLDMFTPLVTQTSIAHLPKEKLERLPIFYFSLAEQRAIAEQLAAVDERIAAEVKAAEKYRKVKVGLMEKLLTPPADAEIEDLTREVAG